MNRIFILVSDNLSVSRQLNIDEALDSIMSYDNPDNVFLVGRNNPERIKQILLQSKSGKVFDLQRSNNVGFRLTAMITVLDIKHQ